MIIMIILCLLSFVINATIALVGDFCTLGRRLRSEAVDAMLLVYSL